MSKRKLCSRAKASRIVFWRVSLAGEGSFLSPTEGPLQAQPSFKSLAGDCTPRQPSQSGVCWNRTCYLEDPRKVPFPLLCRWTVPPGYCLEPTEPRWQVTKISDPPSSKTRDLKLFSVISLHLRLIDSFKLVGYGRHGSGNPSIAFLSLLRDFLIKNRPNHSMGDLQLASLLLQTQRDASHIVVISSCYYTSRCRFVERCLSASVVVC